MKSTISTVLLLTVAALFVGKSNGLKCYQCYWNDAGYEQDIPIGENGEVVIKYDADCTKDGTPKESLVTDCVALNQGDPEPACLSTTATIKSGMLDKPLTVTVRACSAIIPGFTEGCKSMTIQDVINQLPEGPIRDEAESALDRAQMDRTSGGEVCNCKQDKCNGKGSGDGNGDGNGGGGGGGGAGSLVSAVSVVAAVLVMLKIAA